MFTKLTKYEWMATARLMLPLYLVFCFLTIITRIIFSLNITDGIFMLLPQLSFPLFIIGIIILMVTTLILTILRFYNNLMTGEGYLMFTLPVNVHMLIFSKLMVSTLWLLCSAILCFTAMLIVLPEAAVIDPSFSQFTFTSIIKVMTNYGVGRTLLLLITILLILILNLLSFYTSISIGQMKCQNKILGSFLAYLGIYTVYQCLSGIILLISYLFHLNFNDPNTVLSFIITFGLLLGSIGSVVLYRLTSGILRKRLNLA